MLPKRRKPAKWVSFKLAESRKLKAGQEVLLGLFACEILVIATKIWGKLPPTATGQK